MSGIVGSAGAKSGVIGTTELDYEEGTFKALYLNGSEESGQADSEYVKIGKWVFCNIRGETNSASGAHSITCKLPFPIGYYYRGRPLIARISESWHDAYHYNSVNQTHLGLYTDGHLNNLLTASASNYCYIYGNILYSIA